MNQAVKQITRAAGTVMAAFFITQIIGLVRGILISYAFGTSADLDSFNAANRVSEMLFNLMAGGALGSAFIPTFTALLTHHQHDRAWKLASAVANLLIIILTGVAIVMSIFAAPIVRYGLFILAPDLPAGQEVLTIQLLRLLMPTIVIFGLSGLVMGILNGSQKFLLPAIAPAMYSLGQIAGLLFFPQDWGILRLAAGALLGSLLHLCIQLPGLLRLNGWYTFTLGKGIDEVREVLRLMGPRILGVAVVQINFIVNTIIALALPEGSASSLALGFSLMLMPQVAIAQSIAIAALPTFSAQVALNKMDELRSSFATILRGILLLAVPAAIGLIILRMPFVRSLYERGSFTAHSTELVAWALLWYAAGLIGHSMVEILSRTFYSLHDTKTPVTMVIIAMGLNVAFSFAFTALFRRIGWMPHGGLALANSLATFLEMCALLFFMRRRLGNISGSRIWRGALQAGLAGLGMAAGLWGWLNLTAGQSPWIQLLGGTALGVVIYAALLALLRVEELGMVRRIIIGRLKRR